VLEQRNTTESGEKTSTPRHYASRKGVIDVESPFKSDAERDGRRERRGIPSMFHEPADYIHRLLHQLLAFQLCRTAEEAQRKRAGPMTVTSFLPALQ
jgi:hypothetical protein